MRASSESQMGNGMKKKAITGLTLLLVMVMILSGCKFFTTTTIRTVEEYRKDDFVLDKYVSNLNDIEKCEYLDVHGEKRFMGIKREYTGADVPRYMGLIYVSEAEGKRLMQSYDWTTDNGVLADLGKMNKKIKNVENWYTSEVFVNDVFRTKRPIYVVDVRFDGEGIIVFDISSYEEKTP